MATNSKDAATVSDDRSKRLRELRYRGIGSPPPDLKSILSKEEVISQPLLMNFLMVESNIFLLCAIPPNDIRSMFKETFSSEEDIVDWLELYWAQHDTHEGSSRKNNGVLFRHAIKKFWFPKTDALLAQIVGSTGQTIINLKKAFDEKSKTAAACCRAMGVDFYALVHEKKISQVHPGLTVGEPEIVQLARLLAGTPSEKPLHQILKRLVELERSRPSN